LAADHSSKEITSSSSEISNVLSLSGLILRNEMPEVHWMADTSLHYIVFCGRWLDVGGCAPDFYLAFFS